MSVKLTWYGHAAMQLDVDGIQILIDPYLSENPVATVKPEALKPDYILITHGHFDHVGDAEEIAKRSGATLITNFEIANWYAAKGVTTHGQHIGGGHQWPFGYLKFTQALHGSGLPDGAYGGNPAGFLLTTPEGEKVYLTGDTGLFSDMRLVGEAGIDLAVLPIGDNYTMGPEDALRAVKFIQPKHVIPIHYNTWELISQDPDSWSNRVERETGAKVHVLKVGESFTLP